MGTANLTQNRNLSELVFVEYQALFAQAFSYIPKGTLDTLVNPDQQAFILTDLHKYLTIYNDGSMLAEVIDDIEDTRQPARFNAVNVVNQLAALGVNLSTKMLPKSPEDRLREQEAILGAGPCPTSEVAGSLFRFKLLSSNLPEHQSEGLNMILSTAYRWASGESLHTLASLEDFNQKLFQELYYMEVDSIDVKSIQIQWLDKQVLAIASQSVPVTVYAMISLVEKEVLHG